MVAVTIILGMSVEICENYAFLLTRGGPVNLLLRASYLPYDIFLRPKMRETATV